MSSQNTFTDKEHHYNELHAEQYLNNFKLIFYSFICKSFLLLLIAVLLKKKQLWFLLIKPTLHSLTPGGNIDVFKVPFN